jgi:hypothetical protein
MYEFFFESGAAWYTVPALVGTIFFLIRLKLMLLGIAGDLDMDHDVHDSGDAFQILSIQSIAAFAMGFGWGGLGAMRGFAWEGPAVVITAVLIGAGMVWLLAILLKGVADLQSSGNIMLAQTVGKEGEVYTTIPAGGSGRIRLVIAERLRTYTAIAAPEGGAEDIPTGARVRVISTNPDNTVTVVRA